MRVITGIAGGRKLKSPDGEAVRPTADHVKQAMFNILQFDLEGRRVLDLFGGSGQLGIEALSRGARETVFVDSSRTSAALIRENLKRCGLNGRVLQTDALSFLARGEKFDVIFIDPPYDSGLYAAVLERINAVDNLTEGGIIVCEARAGTELPEMTGPYRKLRERRYGSVKICLYTKAAYEQRQ
ncbi:MAG: 16S rRNA (guanine(966)-N(2))-methyltransferase RsmD [Oscillospiraceae bacterium]|nr:16S rRNA (guanine(966)-N(2))-methyltransferase RsmD [Oscillospiraceae bacterium]